MPSLAERFWSKVDVRTDDECWPWTASRSRGGYGWFRVKTGISIGAHRQAYELSVGPIPDDLHIDHLCRNRACVNPRHMEPVTPRENVLRGVNQVAMQARQTACSRGHEFTPENTYVEKPNKRHCKTCRAANLKAWHARKAAA